VSKDCTSRIISGGSDSRPVAAVASVAGAGVIVDAIGFAWDGSKVGKGLKELKRRKRWFKYYLSQKSECVSPLWFEVSVRFPFYQSIHSLTGD